MKCTVVIPLYNGEKWIIEQLESILDQTRKADKLVMIDDCSTDGTFFLVNEFIEKHSLCNWELRKNNKNTGYRENFKQLVLSTDTEVVITADQDDKWYNNKIEVIMEVFENNPEVELLGHGRDVFWDENISDERKQNIERVQSLQKKEKSLPQLSNISNMSDFYMTNHRIAFKNTLVKELEKYSELISSTYDFDQVIGHIARYRNSFYYTNLVLMSNRQHDESTSAVILSKEKDYLDTIKSAEDFYLLSKQEFEDSKKWAQVKKYGFDLSIRYGMNRLNFLKRPSVLTIVPYVYSIILEKNRKIKLRSLYNDINLIKENK